MNSSLSIGRAREKSGKVSETVVTLLLENFCSNLRVSVSKTWKIKVKHAAKHEREGFSG